MSNIFNLEQEYLQLISEIEELDGEITPEIEERLAINSQNVHNKLRSYRYITLMIDGDIRVIDDEIERLKNLKESKSKAIERVRKVMLDAVLLFGTDGKSGNKKMDFAEFKMWTTNRKSVFISNEDTFNNTDYLNYKLGNNLNKETFDKISKLIEGEEVKVSTAINKTAIKEALEAGGEVNGAILINKPSLTIK